MRQPLSKFQAWRNRRRLARLARQVEREAPSGEGQRPVVFFNASTRLTHLSLNAAFSLLASWGLRLAGVPVRHFVCEAGMTRCVLGTNPDDAGQPPPCAACIAQSQRLYAGADAQRFGYEEERGLAEALQKLTLGELEEFDFQGQALGRMVLPALRWALRRHHLGDDAATRSLYRYYILSAYSVGKAFGAFLDEVKPQTVVLFNGVMYPEAMARQQALERGLRVITHEVGLRPFTAFFTEGQATAYPMEIPDDFQLGAEQNAQLDAYLEKRFQGEFTMAGIRFWPQMQELDEGFLAKAGQFEQIVPVFTNVIFDTSQVHANRLYAHMFEWLDDILELVKAHPRTLFVMRAHPDEMRPGSRKQSRESVRQWVAENGAEKLPNVHFVDSEDYLSSYALIQRAHFVMVYNSSIGLEASLMGVPVLSGGAARYTQYPTVYFPGTRREYVQQAKDFLRAEQVEQPEAFVQEARRVLYYQLFRTALPFEDYLEAHSRMGYVHLKNFSLDALRAENSAAISAILGGVVEGKAFLV